MFSCGKEQLKTEQKNSVDFYADIKISFLKETKKLALKLNEHSIKAKIESVGNGFTLSIKKKSTLLRKKVLSFYWTEDKFDKGLFEKLIILQNKLKAKRLIGFESSFKHIQFKDSLATVFFQEGIEKRLLESNENREGVLFICGENGVEIICKPKKPSKETRNKLVERVKSWESGELPTACFFDLQKTGKVLSLVKEIGIEKEAKIRFCYYLNPVSDLVEIAVYYAANAEFDNLKSKLLLEEVFKKEIISDSSVCFNRKEFDRYFSIDNGTYILKEDKTKISSNVLVPKGIKISLKEGQEINFVNEGFVLSFSPVNIVGVKFYTSDSTGRGLHVINARGESLIANSSFDGLNSLEFESWKLPSAVTFYESPIKIINTQFLNNKSEDGLNLFRCDGFLVEACTFKNTFSDAFDADFSDGILSNCNFLDLGNDGIDVSGSALIISGCSFENVADKALSAGEKSSMNVDRVRVDGASLAITAKDNSFINISNSTISNSEVVFCAFQKKQEFGPSNITGTNIVFKNIKKEYLIEKKSSLKLNGKVVEKYEESVREILYGNEYGKATVK